MIDRRSFFLAIIAVLMLMHWTPAIAKTISADTFGLHIHGLGKGNPWPSVPFGFVRLWDSSTTWRDLEPKKNEWNFEVLDKYVLTAEKQGVKVLLTLGQTPAWAATDRNAVSPYAAGASSPPYNLDDWRNYVMTVAKRYKGRIRYWEIWNEINVKHFWSGTFAKMVHLEKIAAKILKTIDSKSIVLTPSVQGGAYGKLAKYFAGGGGRYADGISYHFYAPKDDPEVLHQRITRVRDVMHQFGLKAKPLWNTEMGWLLANRDGSFGKHQRPAWARWRKVGYHEAAGFVMRAYLVNLGNGINHIFWYAWNNGAMGLAENRGTHPKPASDGYARTVEWLQGAYLTGYSESRGVWNIELKRNGNPQYILWSQVPRSFKLPDDWNVDSIARIDGTRHTLRTGRVVNIGPEPILLYQNTNMD